MEASQNRACKIPRPQRSGSLRLKGERRPTFTSFGSGTDFHDTFYPERSPSRVGGMAASSLDLHGQKTPTRYFPPGSECGSIKTAVSCSGLHYPPSSGKSKRFVLHCSLPHETDPHYLTPTQRAVREVKHLKAQMKLADGRLQLKQEELLRVTSELVELKLRFSALQELTCESCGAKIAIPPNLRLDGTKRRKKVRSIPSSYSSGSQDSLDGASVTLRADKPTSLTDSGQFEENSSAKSLRMAPDRTSVDAGILTVECREEYHELKAKYNDRIEELLSQLSLLNRSYGDLRGRYEAAECRLHGLEEERRALVREKEAGENRHGRIYMQAFQQGRETARAERKSELDDLRLQKMPELLKGLKLEESQVDSMQRECREAHAGLKLGESVALWILAMRKALKHQTACQETVVKGKEGFDPGVTLQFLKSAIFYFITDPENQEGHLKAIESILGYNETEKRKMNKAVKSWWR